MLILASLARLAMPLPFVIPAPVDSTNHQLFHRWFALPAIKITPTVWSAQTPLNALLVPLDLLCPPVSTVQQNTLELDVRSVTLDISEMVSIAVLAALPSIPTAAPATSAQSAPNAIMATSLPPTVRHARPDFTTRQQLALIQ